MTDAQKYAKVFRAAADGQLKALVEMTQYEYRIEDYWRMVSQKESYNAIADVFEKIAEAESPRPWLCPDYGNSCGGMLCPGEAKHVFADTRKYPEVVVTGGMTTR